MRPRPVAGLVRWLVALLAAAPLLAAADPLSALQAQAALQRGALAWDVRSGPSPSAGMLPGAARIDAASLDRWLAAGDLAALAEAVSAAGIDLSREVIVYGDAGDPRAQALVASLDGIATGGVHWLVGGTTEWRMQGLPLSAAVAPRWPVPQQLVQHRWQPDHPLGAGALRQLPGQPPALRTAQAL